MEEKTLGKKKKVRQDKFSFLMRGVGGKQNKQKKGVTK